MSKLSSFGPFHENATCLPSGENAGVYSYPGNVVSGTSLGRPYTSGGFSVADNGSYAYTVGSPYRPADVASGRRGGAPRRLTTLNDDLLAHKALGEVEEITWRSVGDLEIEGWIVKRSREKGNRIVAPRAPTRGFHRTISLHHFAPRLADRQRGVYFRRKARG